MADADTLFMIRSGLKWPPSEPKLITSTTLSEFLWEGLSPLNRFSVPCIAVIKKSQPTYALSLEMDYRKAAVLALEQNCPNMSQYLEFKADWIKYWMDHEPRDVATTGHPSPFRVTKEELRDPRFHPNDISPNGRAGYPKNTAGAMGDYVPASALKAAKTKDEVEAAYVAILEGAEEERQDGYEI